MHHLTEHFAQGESVADEHRQEIEHDGGIEDNSPILAEEERAHDMKIWTCRQVACRARLSFARMTRQCTVVIALVALQ